MLPTSLVVMYTFALTNKITFNFFRVQCARERGNREVFPFGL